MLALENDVKMGGREGDPQRWQTPWGFSPKQFPYPFSPAPVYFLIGHLESDMDEIFYCLVGRKGEEKSWCLWFPPVLVK